MPRHPPCALTHLHTTRCSHPLCNTQHTTTPQPHNHHHTHPTTSGGRVRQPRPEAATKNTPTTPGVPSGPNSVPSTLMHNGSCVPPSHTHHHNPNPEQHTPDRKPQQLAQAWNTSERRPKSLQSSQAPHPTVRLLRKEVIQPHLPVRLPCYDFVPIASPTFDNSLPQGVRPSASGVTNFRDVTGGVYKARERIHRSVADLRLLATPTSRGRVADPDPN